MKMCMVILVFVLLTIMAASTSAQDWWPMFHHDLSNTGYSTSTGPNTNNILWSYTAGGHIVSSPAVVGGKLYVGSWDSKLYCLDASTGDFIWSFTTGNFVHSSPAVADGRVYVGSDVSDVRSLCEVRGELFW